MDCKNNNQANLTLTKENTKLSNNLFVEKQKEYEESNYKITRQLTKYKDWTSKEIKSRSIRLSEIATEIWPLPEVYNSEKEMNRSRSGLVFTLEDDPELFNGTRPSAVMFYDEVINVGSWTDVYMVIYSRLYKLAPETYIEYFNTEDNIKENILSTNPDLFKQYYKLDDGVYLNMYFRNVKRMMKKMQLFADFYSEETSDPNGNLIENVLIEI